MNTIVITVRNVETGALAVYRVYNQFEQWTTERAREWVSMREYHPWTFHAWKVAEPE